MLTERLFTDLRRIWRNQPVGDDLMRLTSRAVSKRCQQPRLAFIALVMLVFGAVWLLKSLHDGWTQNRGKT